MNYTFDEWVEILRNCRSMAEIDFVESEIKDVAWIFPIKEFTVLRGIVNLKKQIINGKIS